VLRSWKWRRNKDVEGETKRQRLKREPLPFVFVWNPLRCGGNRGDCTLMLAVRCQIVSYGAHRGR
jgi:hypothetical protein